MSHKFWIVEYVDVNAPRAERSEICLSKSEARHRSTKREAILHYETIETFAGRGLCDSPAFKAAFYNELNNLSENEHDARI